MKRHGHYSTRLGFTLIELLIVIGIILIAVAAAVPAFNVITGARSQDAAQNQISALLGRARAEAIGLQETHGVMFYLDSATNRVGAAIVRARPDLDLGTEEVALDLAAGQEQLLLPVGVGLQAFGSFGGGTPAEKYVGFNTGKKRVRKTVPPAEQYPAPKPEVLNAYGAVILFDGSGRIQNKPYAFIISEQQVINGNKKAGWTAIGKVLLDQPADPPPGGAKPHLFAPTRSNAPPSRRLLSQVGFVLYDTEGFNAQGFASKDAAVDGGGGNEKKKEIWLNEHGLAFLVNRYNGNLVRGE